MKSVRIDHFSDALCVWAYVSQVRCDELLANFPGQVTIDCRFFQVFGDVAHKMETTWSERGGLAAYASHVKEIVDRFGHVSVHGDVWLRHTPTSSLPSHLFLCGVRLLEGRGEADAGALQRAAWTLRQAFFVECADVSRRGVLLELGERAGLDIPSLEALLASGEAHASLSRDLEQARELGIRSSPTLVFNEGRQRLTGNVGYRIIEANVRELLERPAAQLSWC